MNLILFLLVLSPLKIIAFATTENPNANATKIKRTIAEIRNPGEVKPVGIVYHIDTSSTESSQQSFLPNSHSYTNQASYYNSPNKFFANPSPPIKTVFDNTSPKIKTVFENPSPSIKNVFEDTPKAVTAEQVLYEYEQTPTNAVSNVHVKQLFQPLPGFSDPLMKNTQVGASDSSQFISSAETIVNPVQHSAVVNHGQNYANVNFHPLYNVQPLHTQNQQQIPGKYLYLNGKIVYQPGQVGTHQMHPRPPYQNFHNNHQNVHNLAYQQNQQKLPLNYVNRPLHQRLTPPPTNFARFHPPTRSQMQSITHPVPPPVTSAPVVEKNEEAEEEDDKEDIKEEEEVEENEEDGEKENLQEEEEEEEGDYKPEHLHDLFGKYRFDDEEDDDHHYHHQSYRDHEDEEAEEDDEDSRRGSSKQVSSKTRKPLKKKKGKNAEKYDKKDSYSFSEGYSTSSKYENPGKSKKGKGKPKGHFKKVKYSSNSNGKPKYEVIEGKHSENIPVTHKHKFLKEKFYITRSFDDRSDDLKDIN